MEPPTEAAGTVPDTGDSDHMVKKLLPKAYLQLGREREMMMIRRVSRTCRVLAEMLRMH